MGTGGDAPIDPIWSSLKGKYRIAQGYAMAVNNDLINCIPEGVECIWYSYCSSVDLSESKESRDRLLDQFYC